MDVKTPPRSGPHDTEHAGDTWRTRPERIGTFIGTLFLCLLLPILVLWLVPDYFLRKEYGKALACVAVVVGSFFLIMLIVTA
jgi:hypothetical protein